MLCSCNAPRGLCGLEGLSQWRTLRGGQAAPTRRPTPFSAPRAGPAAPLRRQALMLADTGALNSVAGCQKGHFLSRAAFGPRCSLCSRAAALRALARSCATPCTFVCASAPGGTGCVVHRRSRWSSTDEECNCCGGPRGVWLGPQCRLAAVRRRRCAARSTHTGLPHAIAFCYLS